MTGDTLKFVDPRQSILAQRCYSCHGEQVQMKNVRLDSADNVKLHAQNIYQQVVVSQVMPMNNSTAITAEERLLIKQWFEAGGDKTGFFAPATRSAKKDAPKGRGKKSK